MPTVALHSHYWIAQGAPPEPPIGASGDGGYVPFQTTVLNPIGGFGVSVSLVLWALALPAMTKFGG